MNQYTFLLFRKMIFDVFDDDLVEVLDFFKMSEAVFDYLKIDNVHIDVHEPTTKYVMEQVMTFNPFWKYFLNFAVEAMNKIE